MITQSTPWQTRQKYLELLQECGIADFINADESTPFLAEIAWLNYWNTQLNDGPNQEGVDEIAYIEGETLVVEFTYQAPDTSEDDAYQAPDASEDDAKHTPDTSEDDAQHVIIIYTPSTDIPGSYSVQINDDGQMVYYRTAWQDEATESDINAMAGDPEITDEQGNMLFHGDHTNI